MLVSGNLSLLVVFFLLDPSWFRYMLSPPSLASCSWRLSKCPSQQSPVSHAFGWVERHFLEQMKYSWISSEAVEVPGLSELSSWSVGVPILSVSFSTNKQKTKNNNIWSKCSTSVNHLNLIRQLMDNMMHHCLCILWGQLL